MKIINRMNITETIQKNHMKNETSILPMLSANPLVLVDWYLIDKERSTILPGFDITHGNVVGENSKIVFNKIRNLPVAGIDNLLIESEYDEENGLSAEYSSNAFIFSNTVNISEDNFFVVTANIYGKKVRTAFRVTSHRRNFIKNMSIMEFDFSFYYSTDEFFNQLENQVNKTYTCLSTNLGPDGALVIEEDKVLSLKDRVNEYSDLVEAYKNHFYSQETGQVGFTCKIMNPDFLFLDRIHNALLVANNILYFDDVLQFGKSEFNLRMRNHVIDIDLSIKAADVNNSVIGRLWYRKPFKGAHLYPQVKPLSVNIAKYQSTRMVYCSNWYDKDFDQFKMLDLSGTYHTVDSVYFNIFDNDFIQKIENNEKYDIENNTTSYDINSLILRNVVIDYYNGTDIDFDKIELYIVDSIEFFYLFPILLLAYANQIKNIIK